MPSTGLEELDRLLGGEGYPERSTVMVVGPPGIGKEALGYWFLRSSLARGEFCLFVTRLTVSEVKQDIRAFRADGNPEPLWVAPSGGQVSLDINDLVGLSSKVKEALRTAAAGREGGDGEGGRRVRVVTDVISSLLMLNAPDTVYRFLAQLFSEVKQNYEAVVLATVEEGMHPSQSLAAMQQLFDCVLELKLFEKGVRVVPLMRIVKMRGLPPQPGYFRFGFVNGKMEIGAFGR